jgi:ribosomal protein L22
MNPEAINTFLKRIQESTKARSQELRITMQEAHEIAAAISLVLAKNNNLLEQVVQLQDSIIKNHDMTAAVLKTGMDGGGFNG